ncbi:hypothetical protein KNE206_48010 [Kitasatospora sp. NE20-6]|uniref:hypothetical protein n=1 Tax=Kitasatospora sp. NE20-6 TaxID=2859066 RepID=UPI0034DC31EB
MADHIEPTGTDEDEVEAHAESVLPLQGLSSPEDEAGIVPPADGSSVSLAACA